mgnify:CR=1 FL=1
MVLLKESWTEALPSVLALIQGQRRDLFRHELQRFLAFSRMQPDEAEALAGPLRDLLLQSARAARQPTAINATRQMPQDVASLVILAEHLLARWRQAEADAASVASAPADGMSGPTFFGTRLGGPGRDGAVARRDLGLDD